MLNKKQTIKTLIFMSFITFISSLFGCKTSGITTKEPNAPLIKYSYRLSNTSIMPMKEFTVEKIDEITCKVTFASDFDPQKGGVVMDSLETSIGLLQEIEKEVRAHKMYKYKEHYTPPFRILDGKSWIMSMKFEDSYFYSSGENEYPSDNGLYIIADIVEKAIQNHKK